MNKKLFTTKKMAHRRIGHFRKGKKGGFIPSTIVNGTKEDKNLLKTVENESENALKKQKRSAAAKKAWETIRRKKKEEAERKGKKYRSIDDEGEYGE